MFLKYIICCLKHPQAFYIGLSESEVESEKVYGATEQGLAYATGKDVRGFFK